MKLLYLCPRRFYDTKMSRVRFQSMEAVGKISDLTWSGRGWDGYDNQKTVQENIDRIYGNDTPDMVIAYKPLELVDFHKTKTPKCLRYNEMWDKKWTTKEIKQSGADFVVCHHENDMPHYMKLDASMVNISHCAEKAIYKDYGLEKEYDILLTGAVSSHYPFRGRLRNLMKNSRLKDLVRCKVLSHPGDPGLPYDQIKGAVLNRYAMELNKSKISLTCSSRYKYRLGKYVEIPMCKSLLAADLPNEDQDFFKQFMLILDPAMTDDQIIDTLIDHVRDDAKRMKKVEAGYRINHEEYTQEKYAERFVNAIEEFLS